MELLSLGQPEPEGAPLSSGLQYPGSGTLSEPESSLLLHRKHIRDCAEVRCPGDFEMLFIRQGGMVPNQGKPWL